MRACLTLAVVAVICSGCGGTSFEPVPPGDIQPGPGLFTGENGEIVITPARTPEKKQQRI